MVEEEEKTFFFLFFLLLFCHFSPLVQYPPPPHTFFGPLRKKKEKFLVKGGESQKEKKSFFAFPQKKLFLKKEKYTYILFFCKTVLSSNFPSIDSESDSIEFYDLFLSSPFPELFPVFFVSYNSGRESEGCKKKSYIPGDTLRHTTRWRKKKFFSLPVFCGHVWGKSSGSLQKTWVRYDNFFPH